MQRAGGVYERNVSLFNEIASSIGMSWGVTPTVGGVTVNINDNLFLNANSAFVLGNTNGGNMRNNMLLRGPESTRAIDVSLNGLIQGNMGVHNVRFENNRISGNFTYAGAASTSTSSFSNLTFTGNSTNMGAMGTSVSSFLASVALSGDADSYGRDLIARDRANYTYRHRAEAIINHYRGAYGMSMLP